MEEERGFQENLPTKTLGQSEDGNTAWVLSREEIRFFTKAKGSSIEDMESSFFSSGGASTFVRASRETRVSVELGVGGEEGGFSAGKKMQSFSIQVDGISGGDIDP